LVSQKRDLILTLKYKNKKLWKRIIEEFDDKNSIGHISYKYNVKRSVVENSWAEQFGIKKVKEREEKLFGVLICCPVCKKVGSKSHISRHLMNSIREEKHSTFIKKQDKKIKDIYDNTLDSELDPYKISHREDLFCSGSYIRKIFSSFSNYKERFKNKRSIDIKEQYADGRRKRPTQFSNGWKLNKENGGKRFISKEVQAEVVFLYKSHITQKKIAKRVGCKEETVNKYWAETFGKCAVKTRNRKTFINDISKIKGDKDNLLKKYFYENRTKRDLAEEFGVSVSTILNFFKKHFTTEERKIRSSRLQKYGLLKSLKINGTNGKTGSIPENKCYELLKSKVEDNITHHNFDILPPYELDITITKKKIAISWDGPFHRYPIFGANKLKKVKNRDIRKINGLLSLGWKIIIIEDNQKKFNPIIISRTVDKIIDSLNSKNAIMIIENI
jgi:hypothetical protein